MCVFLFTMHWGHFFNRAMNCILLNYKRFKNHLHWQETPGWRRRRKTLRYKLNFTLSSRTPPWHIFSAPDLHYTLEVWTKTRSTNRYAAFRKYKSGHLAGMPAHLSGPQGLIDVSIVDFNRLNFFGTRRWFVFRFRCRRLWLSSWLWWSLRSFLCSCSRKNIFTR